jgi:diguanylate cyclase (GGDEF)-like protein
MRKWLPTRRLSRKQASLILALVIVVATGGVFNLVIQTSLQLSQSAARASLTQDRLTGLSNAQRESLRLVLSLDTLRANPGRSSDAVTLRRGLLLRQLRIAAAQFGADSPEGAKIQQMVTRFENFSWEGLDDPAQRNLTRSTAVALVMTSELTVKNLYDRQESSFFRGNSDSLEANRRSQAALAALIGLVLVLVVSWVVMLTRRARNEVVRSYDALLKEMQVSRLLQEDLAHQVGHDPLTGLANRSRMMELIEAALHRGQRSGSLVGVLFIDLDHFKVVNDVFGHGAGDEVLRISANRMLSLVRAGDTVGRLGGDEFVALIEPLSSPAELVALADRLIAALSDPIQIRGQDVTIGASIGAAVNLDGFTSGSKLLDHADIAAYRAKGAGRGRTVFFDIQLSHELQDRAEQEAAIRVGLANDEFVLYYQPLFDVDNGAVHGYEALIRWQRPERGMVSPDSFIPIAEQSSLICDLDRWVLHEATRQLAQWIRDEPEASAGCTIAVNISGRHLAESSIVPDVIQALTTADIPASRLVLEITETVFVDTPRLVSHLRALRDLGVAISLDDFGTGYTSIGQIPHLHADILKIDRSFVSSAAPGAIELVALMINAAHAFGMHVVAEGVETFEQFEIVRRLGCDSAQGFFFARPQPASAIILGKLGTVGTMGTVSNVVTEAT